MNADELADKIEDARNETDFQRWASDAPDMLRQQADRIAELEKDLHMLQRHYDQLNHDTPQTNPLSDEEILDLCPPNHSEMMNEAYTIDFARAIEERHGIK